MYKITYIENNEKVYINCPDKKTLDRALYYIWEYTHVDVADIKNIKIIENV